MALDPKKHMPHFLHKDRLKKMVSLIRCMLLIVLSIAVLSQAIPADYSCSHTDDLDIPNHVRIKPRKDTDNPDGHSSRTRRDATDFTENFIAAVSYDRSFTTGLSSDVRDRLQNTVIPQLLEFFGLTLEVRPLLGPLLFDRDCTNRVIITFPNEDDWHCFETCEATTMCGPAEIPSDHLKRCRQCNGNGILSGCEDRGSDGPGVDSAFSLYISAKTTGSCSPSSSTLAFAGSCAMEDVYDRPVAGYINFCPTAIDGSQTDDYLLTVAKHEMLHTLGFSSGLFQWWRDENGDPRSPRNANGVPTETSTNTVREVTYNDWSTFNGDVSQHTVSLLVTPKIVEEGKRQFGCSTLEGVQLEDQGGSGTAGSHWEARITKGEGMNGVIATDGVFSRLTFALLEDSGWYKVDYSLAEQLLWGRGSGCEFTDGSCGGYIASQQQQGESISPFCDYPGSPASLYRCNLQRTGVSNCNRGTFSNALPAEYQYFDAANIGGTFQTADFCPFQVPFSNTMCADTGNTQTGLDNSLAQTFGPNSRCVEHGQAWKAEDANFNRQQSFTRAGCYDYTCSNGQVTIHILDQSYVCTTAGEEISVSQTNDGVTYTGSIICPSCLEICYDDFENCPEAAALEYYQFVNVSVTVSITALMSTATTVSNISTTNIDPPAVSTIFDPLISTNIVNTTNIDVPISTSTSTLLTIISSFATSISMSSAGVSPTRSDDISSGLRSSVSGSDSVMSGAYVFPTPYIGSGSGFSGSDDDSTEESSSQSTMPEPTMSIVEPIGTSTGPTYTSTGPTDTFTVPTDVSTGPTYTSTGPTDTSTGPTDTSTGPTDVSTGPTYTSTGPTDTSTGPTDTPTGPTDTPTGPTDTPTRPTDTSTRPTDTSTRPTDTSTRPTDASTARPTGEPTEPTDETRRPPNSGFTQTASFVLTLVFIFISTQFLSN